MIFISSRDQHITFWLCYIMQTLLSTLSCMRWECQSSEELWFHFCVVDPSPQQFRSSLLLSCKPQSYTRATADHTTPVLDSKKGTWICLFTSFEFGLQFPKTIQLLLGINISRKNVEQLLYYLIKITQIDYYKFETVALLKKRKLTSKTSDSINWKNNKYRMKENQRMITKWNEGCKLSHDF